MKKQQPVIGGVLMGQHVVCPNIHLRCTAFWGGQPGYLRMCANNVAGLVGASSVNHNDLIVTFLLEDREERERERPFFVVCGDNDPNHDWYHFAKELHHG